MIPWERRAHCAFKRQEMDFAAQKGRSGMEKDTEILKMEYLC